MAIPADNLVLPPPITRVTQAVDTADPNLPGEIKLDAHGKLFKTYMEYNGFAAPFIEAFNIWTTRLLPAQIESAELTTATGLVKFSQILLEKPKILGRDEILIPSRARNDGLNYNAGLYAKMQLLRRPTLVARPPEATGTIGLVPE